MDPYPSIITNSRAYEKKALPAASLSSRVSPERFVAIHLASACVLKAATPERIVFFTADDRLREAAKREGFLEIPVR